MFVCRTVYTEAVVLFRFYYFFFFYSLFPADMQRCCDDVK